MNSRNTSQKEFIKQYMMNSHSHPTAFDVLDDAKKSGIKIGLTSIYRILNNMVEEKELICIMTKDGYLHYDYHGQSHYHFICNCCNKIVDLKDDLKIINQIINNHLDEISSTDGMTIYGKCKICSN